MTPVHTTVGAGSLHRRDWLRATTGGVLLTFAFPRLFRAEASAAEVLELANGLWVVALEFPGSTSVAIFTFLPLGLTSDGPGQAQWSHLVEHLVIRTTIPQQSAEANAETLPDHMRLDFYGSQQNWRDALTHHRRWIEGVPFTEASLSAEKPRVAAECDFTARQFATHKFAIAAWSHGARHRETHVALKGDVAKATLPEIQRYRDEHLAVPKQTTICVAGGVSAKEVLAEVEKQFGAMRLAGMAVPGGQVAAENTDLTWDLDARHLMITWSIPNVGDPDFPALLVAGHCLKMQLFGDAALKHGAGMVMAGADLRIPEGRFAYVSASLRPDAKVEQIRGALLARVATLGETLPFQVAMIAQQLSKSMLEIPDARTLKLQSAGGASVAMLEANVALLHAMQHHLYGDERANLAARLARVTADDVRRVIGLHLRKEKAAVCTIKPQ